MVRIRKKNHRGAAAVEMAIVLPLLLMLTLGAIRYGWLFLKAQQITNAARYATRIAIRADATVDEVTGAIDALFDPSRANISGHTVKFYKTEIDAGGAEILTEIANVSEDVGVPITVEITVPHENVDIMVVPFMELEPDGWCLGASTTMTKEGP